MPDYRRTPERERRIQDLMERLTATQRLDRPILPPAGPELLEHIFAEEDAILDAGGVLERVDWLVTGENGETARVHCVTNVEARDNAWKQWRAAGLPSVNVISTERTGQPQEGAIPRKEERDHEPYHTAH